MTRVAVVTGAGSGLGLAIGARLAKDGYHVVLAGLRKDRLAVSAAQIGGRAARVDVADASSVREFALALDACDVLVNNAGRALDPGPVTSADPTDWEAMFSVSVLGTLKMTQALISLLKASGGTIVNITSTAAFMNRGDGAGYSAAEHAEHVLTKALRLELSAEPVRVIEIASGMVHTGEFSARFRDGIPRATGVYDDANWPLSAEDVAECVAFAVGLPLHVNIDQLIVCPLARATWPAPRLGPGMTGGAAGLQPA